MQEIFTKIRERLEEKSLGGMGCPKWIPLESAIEIVNEVEAEYGNDGWIPCGERLPKEGVPVLVCNTESRVFIRQINWISLGKSKIPNWSQNAYGIRAWQPLPAPYQPKGE